MSLADPYNTWRVQILEFGTTVTDHSRSHEETKSVLNVGNLCYQSVQNLLCFRLLVSENVKINICKRNVLSVVHGTKTRFFGAFANLRKATISFVVSVRTSVRQHGATWFPLDGFSWNFIFEDFSKICPENSNFIKSDKNNVYFTWRPICVYVISRWILLRMKNVSGTRVRENLNTHFMFSNFFFKNCAFYEIMWKNVAERGRPQMIIWRMLNAWWIPKDTNAHTGCVILIDFPLQQWLHERTWMLRCTFIVCLAIIKERTWAEGCLRKGRWEDRMDFKGMEGTEGRRKLHNEKLRDWYSSSVLVGWLYQGRLDG